MMTMDSYWAKENSNETNVIGLVSGLPLSAYPNGSYFTANGRACTCHEYCTYSVPSGYTTCYYDDGTTSGPGNCKYYAPTRSTQCKAFADYVYEQFNGRVVSNTYKISVDSKFASISNNSTGQALMKEFIYSRPAGTNVRVSVRGQSYNHSFIIISTSDTGATIYDANRDNKCGVKVTFMTWATLASNYKAIVPAWRGTPTGGDLLE